MGRGRGLLKGLRGGGAAASLSELVTCDTAVVVTGARQLVVAGGGACNVGVALVVTALIVTSARPGTVVDDGARIDG